jgi:hypothetical protein
MSAFAIPPPCHAGLTSSCHGLVVPAGGGSRSSMLNSDTATGRSPAQRRARVDTTRPSAAKRRRTESGQPGSELVAPNPRAPRNGNPRTPRPKSKKSPQRQLAWRRGLRSSRESLASREGRVSAIPATPLVDRSTAVSSVPIRLLVCRPCGRNASSPASRAPRAEAEVSDRGRPRLKTAQLRDTRTDAVGGARLEPLRSGSDSLLLVFR